VNSTLAALVAIVGPTGSGKSHLALEIATAFGGEIVNCDSVQVYRGFDIGTAKPPPETRRRVPHHLFDIADAGEVFTAGEYARQGRTVLRDIASRGRIAVIAGGTGFYLRALLEGLAPAPERDESLRERLAAREAHRPGLLHRLLRRIDPSAAHRVHPRDGQKLIRAVEVSILARRPLSAAPAFGSDPLEGFAVLKIGLSPDRDTLYARLNQRAEEMFHAGLLDEVKRLLAAGIPGSAKPFESLGYKQALAVIEGRMSEAGALEEMKMHTRRYAKRQWTWFRRDAEIVWIDGFGDSAVVREQAFHLVTTVTGIIRR
jgi:tRNA dimethylallyltransferase